MTINAGDVRATYTGDASSIKAASEQARKALADTGNEAKATGAKMSAAEAESRKLAASLAATSSAGGANIGKVREGLEKVRGAMAGVGQLAGVATSQFGAFGGVVGNALGAFMSGGAFGVAMAAAAGGLAIVADKFDIFGKKAEEAAKKAEGHFAGLKKEIADLDAALQAMATGTSIEIIKQRSIVAEKDLAARAAVEAAGGAEQYQRFLGYQASGIEIPRQLEGALNAATLALKDYGLEQEKLTKQIANAQFAQHLKDEADASAESAAAKKRLASAEDKRAAELERSLGRTSGATIIDGGGLSRGMAPSVNFGSIGRADTLGDKIGDAFGKKGSDVIGRALGGDLGGALTSAARIAGAAAGVPFAGEIAGAVLRMAEQVASIFMAAGEHMADMLSRPIGAMFSKGGAGRIGGMLGQLGSDLGRAGKTGADMLPMMALMGPAGLGLAGPVAGAMQQQALASVASFAFSLTTANVKFEKFTDVIGQAGTIILDAFAPIWDGLMPISGALVQLAEAFAPVITALISMAPLDGAVRVAIIGIKWLGLAVANVVEPMLMVAAELLRWRFKAKNITEDERNSQLASINEALQAIDGIADITVASAERAALRTEREAARQAAIEKAKERAALRAADALERVAEGAENLPAGYRTAGAEFRSMEARAPSTTNNIISAIQSMTINYGSAGDGPRGIQGIADSIRRRAWSASQYATVGRLSIADLRN